MISINSRWRGKRMTMEGGDNSGDAGLHDSAEQGVQTQQSQQQQEGGERSRQGGGEEAKDVDTDDTSGEQVKVQGAEAGEEEEHVTQHDATTTTTAEQPRKRAKHGSNDDEAEEASGAPVQQEQQEQQEQVRGEEGVEQQAPQKQPGQNSTGEDSFGQTEKHGDSTATAATSGDAVDEVRHEKVMDEASDEAGEEVKQKGEDEREKKKGEEATDKGEGEEEGKTNEEKDEKDEEGKENDAKDEKEKEAASEEAQADPLMVVLEDPRTVVPTGIMDVEILKLIHPIMAHGEDMDSEANIQALKDYSKLPEDEVVAAALQEHLRYSSETAAEIQRFPGRRRSVVYFRDQPFLPSYMWPQGKGEWFTPLLFVKCLLGMLEDPSDAQLRAWGLRKGLTIRERDFLLKYEAFHPAVICLEDRLRMVRVDQVMSWCKEFRPAAYRRYDDARSIPFLGFSVSRRKAMLERFRANIRASAALAAGFNKAIARERAEERHEHHDLLTQVTLTPRDQQLHLVGCAPRSKPFAHDEGQLIEPVKNPLEDETVAPARPPSAKVVSVLHSQRSGERKEFDEHREHQKYLVRRAIKKFGGDTAVVMPKAPADTECGVCECTADDGPGGDGEPEELLTCLSCDRSCSSSIDARGLCIPGHVSATMKPEMGVAVKDIMTGTAWNCRVFEKCGSTKDEKDILFCDECDRGFHTYCTGLTSLPRGRWICSHCSVCDGCNFKPDDPSTYKWSHFTDRRDNQRRFLKTFCDACFKKWNTGDFCPICLELFEPSADLLECSLCSRLVHKDCEDLTPEDEETFKAQGWGRFACSICSGFKPELYDAFHRKYQS
ncbi:hypothetical protein PTSG_02551 [Salpingoeca rosetta]|uniref:PHD-type domain-containing protein n=1 Tax=Salpingoeca rosetta (strain ATCC 50818 / BSB-021) TaxID=946362 RepID=F2U2I4_SALR5|nr:uncharacterized protein PTSG_02551 [Salpingoeca rosetta]EGD81836.1 hypothetical protein PTSG_02551 [Salpingoeca rosetta]|eukprot:XP_004997040.1 hypothetical protein PTSG_02551 [Salpingoeca rosetta]